MYIKYPLISIIMWVLIWPRRLGQKYHKKFICFLGELKPRKNASEIIFYVDKKGD